MEDREEGPSRDEAGEARPPERQPRGPRGTYFVPPAPQKSRLAPLDALVQGSPCDGCDSYRVLTGRGSTEPNLEPPEAFCSSTPFGDFECERATDAAWLTGHAALVADAVAKAHHVTAETRIDLAETTGTALEAALAELHCRFNFDAFIELCGLKGRRS